MNGNEVKTERVFGRKNVNADSAESGGIVDDASRHQASQLSHTSLSFGDLVYSFFARKKLSLTGDWIYRDIKLFIPETITYGIAAFLGILIFGAVYVLNFFWLSDFQTKASQQTYDEVAKQFSMMTQFHVIAFVVILLAVATFFLFKVFFLMPNKNRIPVLRAFRGGGLRPSVDSFKNNEMKFWGAPVGDKINIQDPRLHVDWNTGLPFLVLVEGRGTNKSIVVDEKNDLTSVQWDSVLSSAVSTQASIDEWKFAKKQAGLGISPMMIVIGIAIILVLVGAYMFMQPKAEAAAPAKLMAETVWNARVML
jgi:heme/copper-type cytochrome/quinol oxidase subunit 2